MLPTIQEMHFDFDIKADKVDSLQKRSFNTAQKDWLLNEAQWVWLKNNYGITQINRGAFEVTEHRIQDLKNLHIKSPSPQPGIATTVLSTSVYEVPLNLLDYEFLFTTRIRALITKGNCSKEVPVSQVQTDDLNDALTDPFNRPNFITGDVLCVFGKSTTNTATDLNPQGTGSLFLYTDGTFTVDTVYIEYIKYPNRMWFGNYDITSDLRPKTISNSYVYQAGVDPPVNCELNSHVHNEIVDLAVHIASQLIEDPNLIGQKFQKYIQNK
jgi:hypothetical protein